MLIRQIYSQSNRLPLLLIPLFFYYSSINLSMALQNILIAMQLPRKEYVLTFEEGVNYFNLHDDSKSIFWAFNIPSWIHPSYKLRILNRIQQPNTSTTIFECILDRTPTDYSPQLITLYFFEVFRDNNAQRLEYFVQEQNGPLQRRNKMSVKLEKYPQRKIFTITITDHEEFLNKRLQIVQDTLYLTQQNEMSPNMLQYNYIEPENLRYKKQLNQPHFHLAFQGGGAKGIAYIGAYKAIKQMHPNDKVMSVIGSSAGSLCAVAIASGISPQQLIQLFSQMDKIPKDRFVKTEADITPEIRAYVNASKLGIRQFLHEYSLIPNTLFNLVDVTYLEDDQFFHDVLDYALGDRVSIRQMLSLPVAQPVYLDPGPCSGPTQPYGYYQRERLINFYGFLLAKMMTGETVISITTKIIKKVLDKARMQNIVKFNKVFNNNGIYVSSDILAPQVNMYQFYQFTGVELTCTGTDLDSQVLRFFNQKTTPYLPVTMAVIMSASFPIAFEARLWRRQWGKYYIHHANTRLQIDPTGHQFADGGILANLPVMYIDNEEMRPMLFSHMRTENTKLFGFGLDEIPEPPSPQFAEMQQQKRSSLYWKVFRQTPICRLLCYLNCSVPNPEYFHSTSLTAINERVPPLLFVRKLLETYRHANINLILQIFRNKIYHYSQATTYSRLLKYQVSPQLIGQYKTLRGSLIQNQRKVQSMTEQQFGVRAYYSFIQQLVSTNIPIERIIQTKNSLQLLLSLLLVFIREEKKRLTYVQDINASKGISKTPINDRYQQFLTVLEAKTSTANQHLEEVGRQDFFVNVKDHSKQLQRLRNATKQIQFLIQIHYDPENLPVRTQLIQFFSRFFIYYRQHFLDMLNGLVVDVDRKLTQMQIAVRSGAKAIRGSKNIYGLNQFYHTFGYRQVKQFQLFSKHLLELDQPMLRAKRFYDEQQPAIIYYIDQAINRRTSPKIHLVFQARGTIPQLNMLAFKTVREYLREMQAKKRQQTLQAMASIIINENSNVTKKQFQYQDLFILVVARTDLIYKLQQNMRNLQNIEELDLGYTKYHIPLHIQKQLVDIRQQRRKSRCRITNVSTSGLSTFFTLLMILGYENDKIEEEMATVGNYFVYSPFDIQRKYQSFNWAIPNRCRVRELQELVWQERFEIFTAMETAMNEMKVPLNFQLIRQQFEASRDDVFESFRQVLQYISRTEYRAAMQSDPRTYFSQRMSVNLGTTNYYEINRDTSRATKAMVRALADLFENQIKIALYTSGNVWINDILQSFPDQNIRQWLFKGLIIQNLISTFEYKKHLFRVFKSRNINPDIKLKDFYRISPYKITLTFNAVDLTTNKYVFINHHTHPELPLWMALVTAVSLPLIFPKFVVRPIYLNKINPSEAERRLQQLMLESNAADFKHLYTSGNLLDPLPLDLLTSYQTRRLFFNNQDYTFLSFGNKVPSPNPEPTTFLRTFPRLGDLCNLLFTGISYGFSVQPGTIFSDKGAILSTYLNSHDNFMYQTYKGSLLRLPIRIGTLDFHKVGKGSKLAEQILFETQLSTIQKFSPTKRTYIQFQLNEDNILTVRMLSRDINNNDLSSTYRMQFKTISFSGYEVLTKRAIEMDLSLERNLYLRFFYVENGEIKQREYNLDIMGLLDPYWKFKGTYVLEYNKVMNSYIPPLENTQKVPRSPMPGPPIDMLLIQSLVDVQITGLFCELCCSSLEVNKLYFMIDTSQNQCSHCKQFKQTRMMCSNRQTRCPGLYCMQCVQNSFFNKGQTISCKFGHTLVYRNHRYHKQTSKQNISFVRCACCLQPTEDYYEDEQCEMNFCLKCCSQFISK